MSRDGGRGGNGCGGLIYLILCILVVVAVFSIGSSGDTNDEGESVNEETQETDQTRDQERSEIAEKTKEEEQKIEESYGGGEYTYTDFIDNKDDFVSLLSINSVLTPRERSDAENMLGDDMVTWEGIVTDISENHIYLKPQGKIERGEFVFIGDGYMYAPKEDFYYDTFGVKNYGYAEDLGLKVGDDVTIKGSLQFIPPFPSTIDWRMNDGEVIEHRGNVLN